MTNRGSRGFFHHRASGANGELTIMISVYSDDSVVEFLRYLIGIPLPLRKAKREIALLVKE
jgi:hypothetical protein